MRIKSFKQYITESDGKIDLGYGLWTYTYEDRLHASIEGYNYILNNWGLTFKEDHKPNHKSQDAAEVEDYFNITFSILRTKLLELKSLFVESDKTIQIEFYRLIEPKTRQEIEHIFNKANEILGMSMDDSKLLKYMPASDLYLYPHTGKKKSYDPKNDDYLKSRHEI